MREPVLRQQFGAKDNPGFHEVRVTLKHYNYTACVGASQLQDQKLNFERD